MIATKTSQSPPLQSLHQDKIASLETTKAPAGAFFIIFMNNASLENPR